MFTMLLVQYQCNGLKQWTLRVGAGVVVVPAAVCWVAGRYVALPIMYVFTAILVLLSPYVLSLVLAVFTQLTIPYALPNVHGHGRSVVDSAGELLLNWQQTCAKACKSTTKTRMSSLPSFV
jgi:hypothetical protein